MADEKEKKADKRPFWFTTRMLGIGVTTAGLAMWFIPVTHPIAGDFIKSGLALIVGGSYSAVTRKVFNGKSTVAKNAQVPGTVSGSGAILK